MGILYLTDFFYPNKWWIELLLWYLVNYFSQKNEVFVITWKYDETLPEVEKIWQTIIYRIKAKNLYDFYFKAYFFSKKLISENKIDIIHSHSYFTHILAAKLWKKYKIKVFAHIHWMFWKLWDYIVDWKFLFLKSLKFQTLEKIVSKLNVNFICVSKYVYDVLKVVYGVDDRKLNLVYNGLDIDEFKSNLNEKKILEIRKKIAPNNEFIYLFYWRQEKVKNLDFLIKVFLKLNIKAKLVLLLTNFWGKSISKLNYENIEIFEWLSHKDIPNWIKAANVVVFPSIVESFGYVGLEASLLNTPIVASDMWAIPEVVFWKVNFFNPFDEESLKEALLKSYNQQYEEIPYKNFDIKTTITKIEKLYWL